jgi:ferritin
MMNKNVETAINQQINKEEFSSRLYLAMAIWCESNGFPGAAGFLYKHAEEERIHMLKLVHYVADRGGQAKLLPMEEPSQTYSSLLEVFTEILKHEKFITNSINDLYGVALKENEFTTANFLQWYITEQVEEEALFSTILDKIKLVGSDKAGMFHIDKELEGMALAKAVPDVGA